MSFCQKIAFYPQFRDWSVIGLANKLIDVDILITLLCIRNKDKDRLYN